MTTPGEPRSAHVESVERHVSRLAWHHDWILLTTVPTVVAADQLSKLIVVAKLTLGESWPMQGFLRLTHGTNTGSAFGLFRDQTVVLTIASVLAIGFIIYFYRTQAVRRPLTRFTVGLLLGGALGNLIDRIRLGEVVDFIDVGWWPVFNLADSSIVVGMTLLAGSLLFAGGKESDGQKSAEADPGDDPGGPGPESL